MTRQRELTSVAIAFHLVAITIAAIPPPESLTRVEYEDVTRAQAGVPVLTPALNRLATLAASADAVLYRVLAPLRFITRPYISAGLRQKWNMFSNPMREDHYLRIDYYVSAPGGLRLFQELVFPAEREDQYRTLHQFRDKAIFNAIENFFVELERRNPAWRSGGWSADEVPARLAPIARHFTQRFRVSPVTGGETVVRTELWYGSAAIPPPGTPPDREAVRARLDRLEYYRDPSLPAPRGLARPAPLGATASEVDMLWLLVAVQTP